jgi:alanine racemase
VLAWKTQITSLRTLRVGETAGYGNTFAASAETRLALIPVGYADGFNRLLSNRGEVLLHGQRAPIAGRVSMDQTILDVTAIPAAAIGDEVVLLGSQANETLDAWELADLAETIPWEVLCTISSRVPRIAV